MTGGCCFGQSAPQAKRIKTLCASSKHTKVWGERMKTQSSQTTSHLPKSRWLDHFANFGKEINQNQSAQTLSSAIFCMLSSRLFSILQLFHLVGHSSGQGPERCSPPRAPSSCQRETQRGPRDRARAEISFIGHGAADPWLILAQFSRGILTLPPPSVSSL